MIGRTLRQYVVTAHLGQGGMGEVWKARDTILEREVALKILPASEGDAIARKERFFREARAASALNHPNIVTIYEINGDHGIDFIAMELVEGRTLSKILREGSMSIVEVQQLALQMGGAVGRAHRAGIVHRDLKPGNIMVTDDGLLKVLDFGLAKVGRSASEAPEAATQMALTRLGTSVGTIGYMSPEQAVGDIVDARSDVFSFGVILYEMLAGRRPFVAAGLLDLLHELHFSDPPPVESLRSDTPPALAAIVSRALAKKPAERYADLTEAVAALRAATGEPASRTAAVRSVPGVVEARPNQASGRGRRWSAVAMASALAVALVVGGAIWQRAMAPRGPQPADPPGGEPSGSASVSPTSPSDLTREAASLLARQDREGNVDRAIALLEQALALDRNSAVAHAHLSEAYRRKHLTNPDAQWLNLSREAAERAVTLNPDLAAAHMAMGLMQLAAGQHPDALASIRRAIDLDPANPIPRESLGQVLAASNEDVEAEAAFTKAVQLGPEDWRPPISFGQFYFSRARYAEAAAQWEAALKLTPDNALVLRNLGAAYYLSNRHDEAASILQRALEVRPTAATYTNLGTIRFFQGRYLDAVVAFEKAVELGANSHLYWGNLGDGYRWAPGRRADAPAAYRRALDLIQGELENKPGDLDLRSRHALYLVKMGNQDAARRAIEGLDDQPKLTAQMLYRLAVIHELLGARVPALRALERALKSGYPARDLAAEPELMSLRADARYHRLLDTVTGSTRPR
jgi:eukaryotic-like serine/threonine-protein kinase